MKTTDLFKINKQASRLNESLSKTFGQKLNLENFDLHQLQDARNKIRTQLSQIKSDSGFNENLENDAYHKAQFMLDTLNAEIMEREEFVAEVTEEDSVEESGLQYYTGVKKHGEKYMKAAAAAGRDGASQEELGALKDKLSKAHKGKDKNEGVEEDSVAEGSAHGYNVVKWYEKWNDQSKLVKWLRKEAGIPKDDDIYFDDADLVYGDQTIVRDALVDPNLKFIDLLNAVAQATGGRSKQKVQGVYRDQNMAEGEEGFSIEDMVMDQYRNGNEVWEIASNMGMSEDEVQDIINDGGQGVAEGWGTDEVTRYKNGFTVWHKKQTARPGEPEVWVYATPAGVSSDADAEMIIKKQQPLAKFPSLNMAFDAMKSGKLTSESIEENKKGVKAVKRKVASIEPGKPRNFVAKNAVNTGAGAHKDKKKAAKQGEVKHKTASYEN